MQFLKDAASVTPTYAFFRKRKRKTAPDPELALTASQDSLKRAFIALTENFENLKDNASHVASVDNHIKRAEFKEFFGRGPANPIKAPGSAMTTSPMKANEAETPPIVGSVRTLIKGILA